MGTTPLLGRSAEDRLVGRLVGRGSRKGSTPLSRAGDVIQRPPSWAALAALMSLTGRRGRRAALRGSGCYLAAVAAHLPIKAVVGRRHPPGAALHQLGPFTSSFPSGHAAADLAFVFGASQEVPKLLVPLSAATMAVHWSLVRKRAHYPSDVVVGGALGIAVALVARRLWPPARPSQGADLPLAPAVEPAGGGGAGQQASEEGERSAREHSGVAAGTH